MQRTFPDIVLANSVFELQFTVVCACCHWPIDKLKRSVSTHESHRCAAFDLVFAGAAGCFVFEQQSSAAILER